MHLESNAFQLGFDFIHLWFISEVITVNASDSCLMAKSTLHLPGASFHLLWCVTVNETKRCPYYLVFFENCIYTITLKKIRITHRIQSLECFICSYSIGVFIDTYKNEAHSFPFFRS